MAGPETQPFSDDMIRSAALGIVAGGDIATLVGYQNARPPEQPVIYTQVGDGPTDTEIWYDGVPKPGTESYPPDGKSYSAYQQRVTKWDKDGRATEVQTVYFTGRVSNTEWEQAGSPSDENDTDECRIDRIASERRGTGMTRVVTENIADRRSPIVQVNIAEWGDGIAGGGGETTTIAITAQFDEHVSTLIINGRNYPADDTMAPEEGSPTANPNAIDHTASDLTALVRAGRIVTSMTERGMRVSCQLHAATYASQLMSLALPRQ